MKFRLALLAFTASAALSACNTIYSLPDERVGSANLASANGMPAGTAQLLRNGETISVAIAAVGLTPGEHGFHLHTTGACTAPDFKSAGGHLNPAGNTHGARSSDGKHLGDLPNLVADASGTASTQVDLTGSADDILTDIFDSDGTAIVIHAGPDDYISDPAGAAGPRVACGVLKPA